MRCPDRCPARRRLALPWSIALAASLSGLCCAPDLHLDPGASIACASNADCPSDHECGASGRCVQSGGNAAPAVSLGAVVRATATVSLPVTIVDLEGNDVTLSLRYTLDDPRSAAAVWLGIEPGSMSPLPEGLASAAPDNVHTLLWNAVASAAADVSSTLEVGTNLVASDSASPEVAAQVVGYTPEVVVEVVGIDAFGNRSAPTRTAPFAMGNAPPAVSWVEGLAAGAPLQRFVPLEVQLSDSASDPAVVEMQFRTPGDLGWRTPTAVAGGTDTPLATTAAGETRVFVWDSAADLGSGTFEGVEVQVRAWDTLDGAARQLGDWQVQTLPRITNP